MANDQESQIILPIIDSHVHIYTGPDADSHAWMTPDSVLRGQFSVEQYKAAARAAPSLLGFIFVEVDRKSHVDDESGWEQPLAELAFLRRVALGQPANPDADGHSPEDARLCLAIVPWLPVPSGLAVVERYLDRAKEVAGDAWPKVRGFRYLLQDKPHGTMLQQDFVDVVRMLGRRGYVFELGIDHHRRGKKQLDEVVELVDRVHDGVPEEEKTTFIIDHLGKPDLSIYNTSSDPVFNAWRIAMYTLSKASNTYMKLSGGFSEMSETLCAAPASQIFPSIFPWLGVVLATFGPSRAMFGSDWPVCVAGGGKDAWQRWREVTETMCHMASFSDDERAMIWGGTAKRAYKL